MERFIDPLISWILQGWLLAVFGPLGAFWFGLISHKGVRRLGIPRLGTWRKQKQGLYEKVMWPPMALRIGLLKSSALQNDGLDAPVILQCRTPQETNPKGHWGPHYFFIQSLCLLPPCTQSWYTQSPHPIMATLVNSSPCYKV